MNENVLFSVLPKPKYDSTREPTFFLVKWDTPRDRFIQFIEDRFDKGYFDLRTMKSHGWTCNNILRNQDVTCLTDA